MGDFGYGSSNGCETLIPETCIVLFPLSFHQKAQDNRCDKINKTFEHLIKIFNGKPLPVYDYVRHKQDERGN